MMYVSRTSLKRRSLLYLKKWKTPYSSWSDLSVTLCINVCFAHVPLLRLPGLRVCNTGTSSFRVSLYFSGSFPFDSVRTLDRKENGTKLLIVVPSIRVSVIHYCWVLSTDSYHCRSRLYIKGWGKWWWYGLQGLRDDYWLSKFNPCWGGKFVLD